MAPAIKPGVEIKGFYKLHTLREGAIMRLKQAGVASRSLRERFAN